MPSFRRLLIYGAGLSGIAAARLALQQGIWVDVWDDFKDQSSLPCDLLSSPWNKRLRWNQRTIDLSSTAFMPSPGIDESLHWYQHARRHCPQLLSETDYGLAVLNRPYIAVTGTNGKSTTCMQISHIFSSLKIECPVGGNAGTPLCALALRPARAPLYVLELSSYQLAQSITLNPIVSVITSLSPDHLERHHTWRQYLQDKWRVLSTITTPVYPAPTLVSTQQVLTQTTAQGLKAPYHLLRTVPKALPHANTHLPAEACHNAARYMHRTQRSRGSQAPWHILQRIPLSRLMDIAATAPSLKHRLQHCRWPEKSPITHTWTFIDDSKATNPEATYYALQSIAPSLQKTALILGGRCKQGASYHRLSALPTCIVKRYVFGNHAEHIRSAVAQNSLHWEVGPRLQDLMAVGGVLHQALLQGAITQVLFSPGGDSFDEFTDFQHRGQSFQHWAHILCQNTPLPSSAASTPPSPPPSSSPSTLP